MVFNAEATDLSVLSFKGINQPLDTIDSLNVSITDQDDHLLNLRNEKLTIRFHIREAR